MRSLKNEKFSQLSTLLFSKNVSIETHISKEGFVYPIFTHDMKTVEGCLPCNSQRFLSYLFLLPFHT